MQICSISKNTFSNQINVQEKFTHESSGKHFYHTNQVRQGYLKQNIK